MSFAHSGFEQSAVNLHRKSLNRREGGFLDFQMTRREKHLCAFRGNRTSGACRTERSEYDSELRPRALAYFTNTWSKITSDSGVIPRRVTIRYIYEQVVG